MLRSFLNINPKIIRLSSKSHLNAKKLIESGFEKRFSTSFDRTGTFGATAFRSKKKSTPMNLVCC
jgi:hypothetical protein